MSKLFKNFFIFALTLLVVASQVEAIDLFWHSTNGLKSSGSKNLTLVGDKLQNSNGKYVLLVVKNNIVYQGLVDDASKATKFDNSTGDYKPTFDTLNNADLVFDGSSGIISTIGGLNVVSASTPEFDIAWNANGLTFATPGSTSHIFNKKFQTSLHTKFLKLVLNGTNMIQELVDNAAATEITVNAGSLTFNIGSTIYTFVNSSAGALAVRDESGADFTLVPYVILTAPSVYWTDGLSFDSNGNQLTPVAGSGIPIGSKYLELKLNGTEFIQLLAETSGTHITDVLGNWTFSEGGVDYTLVNDGNGKVVIYDSAAKAHTLKPYAGPTLYWTYNLTTNPANSVARFNPVTELICHNSSLCLRLSLVNGTTIIQTFNQTSDATKFTQDLATSTWNFDIGSDTYTVTPNSTTTTVKIFDTSSTEIPVAAYTGPKLNGSSSIVTPLFYTLFITLSVAIFAL